jgi:hypothetical protein
MSSSEIKFIDTESTESLIIPESAYDLNNLYHGNRSAQTEAAQGFYSRLANLSNSLYQSQSLINKEQFILLLGAILGGYFTMSNLTPDYRFDKSPTLSLTYESDSWKDLVDEIYVIDSYLDDQPNYSHNATIELAKKIGFPTDFEL